MPPSRSLPPGTLWNRKFLEVSALNCVGVCKSEREREREKRLQYFHSVTVNVIRICSARLNNHRQKKIVNFTLRSLYTILYTLYILLYILCILNETYNLPSHFYVSSNYSLFKSAITLLNGFSTHHTHIHIYTNTHTCVYKHYLHM